MKPILFEHHQLSDVKINKEATHVLGWSESIEFQSQTMSIEHFQF